MGSEVEIRTKGMQWDAIKAEIERAEKAEEQQAASGEPQHEEADQPAALYLSGKGNPNKGSTNCRNFPTKAPWK